MRTLRLRWSRFDLRLRRAVRFFRDSERMEEVEKEDVCWDRMAESVCRWERPYEVEGRAAEREERLSADETHLEQEDAMPATILRGVQLLPEQQRWQR